VTEHTNRSPFRGGGGGLGGEPRRRTLGKKEKERGGREKTGELKGCRMKGQGEFSERDIFYPKGGGKWSKL